MAALPVWALKVACYYGIITCNTRPGVWSNGKPSVVAWEPPHTTTTQKTTTTRIVKATTTGLPDFTTTTHSLTTTTAALNTFTIALPSDTSVIVTVPIETVSPATSSPSTFLISTSASLINTLSSPAGSSSSSSSAASSSSPTSSSAPGSSVAYSSASFNPSPSSLISSSTMASSAVSISASAPAAPVSHATVASNILVIAKDTASAGVASSGLNAYGIPFTTLIVPQAGVKLPAFNTSAGGKFGGIVVASEVSYDYGTDGYQSALSTDQWNQLYAYQLEYGVRMVQYDVYPGPNYGTTVVGDGCCASGVEQDVSFTDISDFPTSGLKTGAGVSTEGLWHYPATISNTTSTKQIAAFAANSVTNRETVAAVINDFDGRQQMAFFIGFDTTWSATSSYLQHAWITWITRGIYAGYRRVNLNTQIDDMFLETDIYSPSGKTFRIRTQDMEGIKNWIPTILAKMNSGSVYFPEVGHNGNGNIENSSDTDAGYTACNGGGIEYDSPPDTALEFQKPLGTGTNLWPATPTVYDWTTACTKMDPLLIWWTTTDNLNNFGSISHTFTHEEQDNATYSDVYKEITFNQAWLKQVGIDQSKHFTANGIIPPAITGLHNGDALRAWYENGITNCVGDNTRPALLNTENVHWPYWTVTATDGFDGMQVNPRWATRIYYNCDTPACTVAEWIATSAGSGTFDDLLATEKADTMRHLFGLYHEGYMFHQANLRNADVDAITINGVSAKYSIFQAWVETQVQEFVRLVDWPLVTLKHADMSAAFLARFNRDKCGYTLSYTTADQKITAVTVSATGNTCSEPIPVTFPVAPSSTHGFTTEQLGSDPLTVWVQLSGSPVTFTLATPIDLV
ncbi:extracellular serine-rich protein [Penicillium cinerascens]|uniref:Extracellular serine-rich protein n=1 Tax=Penicillium cinerascens TaxID=70096 RepID=A0A9W9JKS2_9EURO|nr:extracellular serine-rich protein [Penicillium cinerascens]KAJ5198257.1 extracellular serine-rich protein [Penicillium cinerascens]